MSSIRPTRAISSSVQRVYDAMTAPRSLWKIPQIIGHLAAGSTIALYIGLRSRLVGRPTWVPAAVRWWHRRLCSILGIRMRVHGRVDEDSLLVGNHISWLDIPVVGAHGEIGFLSKAEVRAWPLIGWLAEIAGTHFIERGAHQAQAISEVLLRRITQGHSLMIFPEGTTSDGTSVLRFHPRLFGLVQETGLRIQPVAIAYHRGEDKAPDPIAAFIGDDTLLESLLRIIRHSDLVVTVHFLPPLPVDQGVQRRVLAERTRLAITQALGMDPAEGWRGADGHSDADRSEPESALVEAPHAA